MARDRQDQTRFGMPPQRDPFEPFPIVAPWDVPLFALANLQLYIQCVCGTSSAHPLRLLAGERGGK